LKGDFKMPDSIKKYLSLDRLKKYDELIKTKIDSDIANHKHSWNELNDKVFREESIERIEIDMMGQTIGFLKVSDNTELAVSPAADGMAKVWRTISEVSDFNNAPWVLVDDKVAAISELMVLVFFEDVENYEVEEIVFNATKGVYFMDTRALGYEAFLSGFASDSKATEPEITWDGNDSYIKQLDEKYIPDTIARVEDIPEIEVATDEEVITMLMELDMLPTFVDSEGALLIDNNGSIPI